MTRQNTVIIVTILAIVFAVVAAGLVYNYLRKQSQVKEGQTTTIAVAAVNIPIGTKIMPTMVKTAPWPRESVPAGSISDPNALTSRGRVTIKTIAPGEAVTEEKLVPAAGTPGSGFMTYLVPPGHRAVTVAVNEVAGVAGFLTPNNRVDVVLTTPLPGTPNETISKIVLQNVPVLATGQVASQEQKDGKPVVVPTVTLDLVPQDAEKLVLSASKGTLQLLLRNFSDTSQVVSRGATISKVLTFGPAEKTAGAPVRVIRRVPAQRATTPSPQYSVEVIRGNERSIKQFAPAETARGRSTAKEAR